jgi:hypothetical protein
MNGATSTSLRGPYEKRPAGRGVPKLLGEAIWLEWGESGSGLVYWNGSKLAWQQQGD